MESPEFDKVWVEVWGLTNQEVADYARRATDCEPCHAIKGEFCFKDVDRVCDDRFKAGITTLRDYLNEKAREHLIIMAGYDQPQEDDDGKPLPLLNKAWWNHGKPMRVKPQEAEKPHGIPEDDIWAHPDFKPEEPSSEDQVWSV